MKLGFTLSVLVFSVLSFAQVSKKEIKAEKAFDFFHYKKAIQLYEGVEELSLQGKRNLATSYRKHQNMLKAEAAYAELINEDGAEAEDLYFYSYVLKKNKKYLEADAWMAKFHQLDQVDTRAIRHLEDQDVVSELLKDKNQFKVSHLKINTPSEDFGPAFYQDKIVFASTREGKRFFKRKWNGNNLPFLNMYVAEMNSTELVNPRLFVDKNLNKKFHEGPVSFAQDDTFMAFTRNNYDEESSDGVIKLKIYFSSYVEGEWSEPEAFGLNHKEYSVGHPSLTMDGNTMYFVSDMPGGFGGADIYKITRDGSGKWTDLQNLGSTINTEGNEMFPFYEEQQKQLFFASDGQVGLGGLDIYVSPEVNGAYDRILDLGVPINSNKDDFAFILNPLNNSGYFSSNREAGNGDDDLYSFKMLKPFVFRKRLEGIATGKEGEVLADVSVKLYENGVVVDSAITDAEGKFKFTVEKGKNFTLGGSKDKYFPADNSVSTDTPEDVISTALKLEKDPGITLYALVTDTKTKLPLDSVKIKIIDNFTGQIFLTKTTGSSGDVSKGLAGKRVGERLSYNIVLSRPGYFPKTLTFNYGIEKPGLINVHSSLDLSMDKEVTDLSQLVQINPINFDLNKFDIRDDAAIELNKIVEVMNKYPNMVVELGAHTDCRGSKGYNEKLSDRRAKSSAKYIKQNIMNPANIYGKGYGELRIMNGCTCEGSQKVSCTEDQHSANRRTEFKVISIGSDEIKVENTSTDSFDK